ncbi:MAG: hypothetical protein LBE91_12420, partial [Tannerella sp.]|nr:hypothetical protein [Tannerella sp.]
MKALLVGKFVGMPNPPAPPDFPPVPCTFAGLATDTGEYYIFLDSYLVCGKSSFIMKDVEYFLDYEGDIEITGEVTVMRNPPSEEFYGIEIETIKK